MTPEQFFTKNMRWIALCLFLLLCIKSIQSCNRNMSNNIAQKEYIHTIDSLNNKYNTLEKQTIETVSQLKFELKLQSEKAGEANKRADAVQSVAEKIKANTTVNVRGAELDTQKRK
jgi:ATP-dependent exoDNAse (exonuclease V) alpha subunit